MSSSAAVLARPNSNKEHSLLPVVILSLIVHLLVFAGIPLLTKIIYRSEKYERPNTFQLVNPSIIKTVIASNPHLKSAALKKNATTPVPQKVRSKTVNPKENVKEENTNDLSELLDAVQSAPVSDIASTQNFKYHWYLQNLVSKVEEQWKPPMGLTDKKDAFVDIAFTIFQNGSISNVSVVKSSGVSTLDNLALRAISLAAPFGKLPIGFTEDKLEINYTLHYIK
jgi:TonB family protein